MTRGAGSRAWVMRTGGASATLRSMRSLSVARWSLCILALTLALGCGDSGAAGRDAFAPDATPVDGGAGRDGFAADAFEPDEPIALRGSAAVYGSTGELSIERPPAAAEGDLLVLFLSRTDDLLPLRLEGWSAVTACLKSTNTQERCLTAAECAEMDGDYCLTFGAEGTGRDLATAVFTRRVGPAEATSYGWSLRGAAPSWAILAAFGGAAEASPIRASAGTSHDANPSSRFPSVSAEAGDYLLLAQAFDDTAAEDDFLPPAEMTLLRWIAGADEAGYLFGAALDASGPTGERETRGVGGPNAKDLMLTVVVAD